MRSLDLANQRSTHPNASHENQPLLQQCKPCNGPHTQTRPTRTNHCSNSANLATVHTPQRVPREPTTAPTVQTLQRSTHPNVFHENQPLPLTVQTLQRSTHPNVFHENQPLPLTVQTLQRSTHPNVLHEYDPRREGTSIPPQRRSLRGCDAGSTIPSGIRCKDWTAVAC